MLSARIDVAQEYCSGTASCSVVALLWRVSKRYIAVLSLCSPLAYLGFIPFPHPRLWLVIPSFPSYSCVTDIGPGGSLIHENIGIHVPNCMALHPKDHNFKHYVTELKFVPPRNSVLGVYCICIIHWLNLINL